MDAQLIKLARELQTKLALIDDQAAPDTLQSVHELSIKLIDCLETAIPDLSEKREKAEFKALRQRAERLLKEMRLEGDLRADSLEQIERELGEGDPDDPVGVPARRKPGPKGLSGGVALPLPGC